MLIRSYAPFEHQPYLGIDVTTGVARFLGFLSYMCCFFGSFDKSALATGVNRCLEFQSYMCCLLDAFDESVLLQSGESS